MVDDGVCVCERERDDLSQTTILYSRVPNRLLILFFQAGNH
jgi:hypothetical protein